jgi:hypothetical protein
VLGGGQAAAAASPPQVSSTWVTDVTATSATLHTVIDPEGISTIYRFEYLTEAAYQANVGAGHEAFAGAITAPAGGAGPVGSGTVGIGLLQHIVGLTPLTTYRFRVVATSAGGVTSGEPHSLGTEAPTNAFALLDERGWEMVSPVEKGGGALVGPEALFGGGAFQAAAGGSAFTYSAPASFGGGGGAPGASQYIARRGTAGWNSENITAPALSGSYGLPPDGTPYRLFDAGLGRGLLLNGERCRGKASACPVANPPLVGTGAPAGFQDYYVRDDSSESFRSLLSASDLTHTPLEADEFGLSLAGAAPDLLHVVLSSCAALAPGATEVAAPGGCDPNAQNLYLWEGGDLRLVNLEPGESTGTPGATLAASVGAISSDGARVYWTDGADRLFLDDAGQAKAVDESGEAEFQTASADGSVAYFLKAGQLYRYSVISGTAAPISGAVTGVLGASADSSVLYYLAAGGLYVWKEGTATKIADAGIAATDYPPATATARVSPDGSHLLFLSSAELTGYENFGLEEVFLYGPPAVGGPATLTCISCNPTGERPLGGASIPGAVANGSTLAYRPRVLSADGQRAFFESDDALSIQDSNHATDVYEWETAGEGSCARLPGCMQLISSGHSTDPSRFIDASAAGADAFFLTSESLVAADPGSEDIYDAREGGGFAELPSALSCDGDACQALPGEPEDPTPTTLLHSPGNPPPRFPRVRKHRKPKRHHSHRHKARHAVARGGRGR